MAMPLASCWSHAHGQRLDAARDQEAIHGREAGSGGALEEIDFLGVGGASEDDGAAGASLWPFRYLVIECTTMCAPSSMGCCR